MNKIITFLNDNGEIISSINLSELNKVTDFFEELLSDNNDTVFNITLNNNIIDGITDYNKMFFFLTEFLCRINQRFKYNPYQFEGYLDKNIDPWLSDYLYILCPHNEEHINSFLQISELYQFLLFANFFGMNDLFELLCAKMASIVKYKMPHEIRQIYGIDQSCSDEHDKLIFIKLTYDATYK